MTAKEYLNELRGRNARIKALEERRKYYLTLATRQTSSVNDAPASASHAGSKVEEYSCRIADLAKVAGNRIAGYALLTRRIEEQINALRDIRYRDVLTYRYINEWSWLRIAREMHYSKDHVWSLHREALSEFERLHLNSK